jgi:hypothetical protein
MSFRLGGITMVSLEKRGATSWRITINAGKDASGKYIHYGKTVRSRTKKDSRNAEQGIQQDTSYLAPLP